MRLVEDDDAGFGEYARVGRGAGLQFDGEIGEEEVVVDDDDVALGGAAAHFGNEAALVVGAALAEAGLAARVKLGPELAGLGQIVELDAVAGLGGPLPLGDLMVLRDLFEPVEDGLIAQGVELVAAEIVGAALHIADPERTEKGFEEGDVLEKELLLEIFRAGRDDDTASRAQRRQQIGEGLAGAGSGLDDQVTIFVESALDGLRHFELSAAELVGQLRAREHAAGSEEVIERRKRGHGLAGGGQDRDSRRMICFRIAGAMWKWRWSAGSSTP